MVFILYYYNQRFYNLNPIVSGVITFSFHLSTSSSRITDFARLMRRNLGNTQPEGQLVSPDRVRLDLGSGVLERQLFRVGEVIRRPVRVVVGHTSVRVAGNDDCAERQLQITEEEERGVHEL
jgi:hypothetical protein